MDSSPGKPASMASLPPVSTTTAAFTPASTTAGVKRPAPSLLPAFEPLSSSPFLPRPTKRQARAGSIGSTAYSKYPTPVPTSSTGILSSSPPRLGNLHSGRPTLQRTASSVSERAPLCAVPSIELNENGETLTMGRSSNASHYQLSANRLISRVHVRARYIAARDPVESNKIEIVCNGWNGLKLHCQGRTWDMGKGDTFTSETENVEIMLDVQDARVRLQWPKRSDDSLATLSDSSWDDSPRMRSNCNAPGASGLQSSPLRRATRITSPESPTPAHLSASSVNLQALISDDEAGSPPIQIFEDASADEQELPKHEEDVGLSFAATEVTNSFSSELSEPQSDSDHENDPNEENDPIVHSFGPFGANLSNRMASFSTMSPKIRPPLSRISSGSDTTAVTSAALASVIHEEPSQESSLSALGASPKAPTPSPAKPKISSGVNVATVTNHLINQLAFSRLSSSPLSTIMGNLPAEEKKGLTQDDLRLIIEDTACVGVIPRQGKDAAGKALESEYYYVPDMDDDVSRRAAVVDGLRKPSLRNCRKQHKQYYWKRPRTP